ncbi:hypothetical protein ACOQFV_06125 [Nocardiopsis changdeensis]|uniref:Uncharacterized protein n=1 Tax=Nocardiopsis changdeensis TaxID=2831969 RepID=A0ABX8BMH1_9ACTN|nr:MULTISPECIES: hypothetical protein [Nocardiopsis]QUX23435.1 hypothetical protein KGD84_03370 [Nocardiopsis changdeensis]QYX39378.1 hypothetical protein K1J57_12820 [Nocardiopsis sp. MT53]
MREPVPVVEPGPLTTGAGSPLFGRGAAFDPRVWKPVDHTVLDSGALFPTYDRA